MEVLRFIFKNLDQFRGRFWVVIIAGLLDGVGVFMVPILLAEFTKQDFNPTQFARLFLYLAAAYLFTLFTSHIIRRWGESLAAQFENYIRLKYYKILEHLPAPVITQYHSGYILSMLNRAGAGLREIFGGLFWNITRGLATLILFFIFTARESLAVALLNTAVLGVFLVAGVFLSRKIVSLAAVNNKANASLLESYADFIANLITVKKLGVYKFAENKLAAKTAATYRSIQDVQNFHALRWSILHLVYGLAYIGTVAMLLYRVAYGQLAPSVLILFIGAYFILYQNLSRITEILKIIMETKAYVLNLEEILRQASPLSHGALAVSHWNRLAFHNVEFRYPNTEKKISIPEFSLRQGEKVAITGVSGLGKTTLLNLVNNFLVPDAGQRLVDDIPYEQVSQDFYGQAMVIASQEIELFNLSLRENITLGQPVSDEVIREALARLDLLPWVEHLEQGLGTIVGEKGVRLSAGQKQRVNLIRALLLERGIYLLDEPTSHLDTATEIKVVEFLKQYLNGKTAVIVTHRPALLELCTRTYSFEGHALKAG